MLTISIIAVLALAILAISQDYRFMMALRATQPDLYQAYGGHTFRPAPRRIRMLFAVLLGRYKTEVTDSHARILAARFRAVLLLFFVVLLASIAYLVTSGGG